MVDNKKNIIILLSVICILILFFLLYQDYFGSGSFLPTGFFSILSNAERLKKYINQYEFFAPFVLFIIQFMQVIISPIPGNVTTVIGGSLFGFFYGLILNVTSIFLGSIIAFLLARKYGKPLVIRFVGKEVYQRYNKSFENKYLISLFLIFLFPFFPDDALCLLSGLSTIPLRIFMFLMVAGRLPGIVIGTLIGSGLLELSLQGWIIIAILLLIILVLSISKGKEIENWLYNRFVRDLEN